MTPRNLLALYRTEMSDTAEPYLWSDEFVLGAIDDAQKQFARKTDGIPDSLTPEVVEIPVEADGLTGLYAADFALHPSILRIRSARRKDTGRDVEIVNVEDMGPRRMFFDGIPGVLRALIIGMDQDRCRVWPAPAEDVTIVLSVFRLPLVTITDDEPFEIPEQHHRHLLMWMKHLGYGVQDAETFDRTKSQEFMDRFEAYCFKAQREQQRARHKTRVVAYGGI
jgi:hypothetical protein